MNREEILKQAIELINVDRAEDYGPAYENHKRIADLWSVVFGKRSNSVSSCAMFVTFENSQINLLS